MLPGGSATELLELAVLAEEAGWDAVFTWEGGYAVDAWSLLSAVAVRTERIRLGTMLTPLPWRRPWKLAGQVVTLDQLSNGRAILAIGLGAVDTGLGRYPEVTDKAERGRLLDDGLDVMRGLWEGERAFDTPSWSLDISASVAGAPAPVQARIPVWCVGAKDRPRSMRRILRCDGLLPTVVDETGGRLPTPEELATMLEWLDANGGRPPGFDVVAEGETEPGDRSPIEPWQGLATWWLETRWTTPDLSTVRARIAAGPIPL